MGSMHWACRGTTCGGRSELMEIELTSRSERLTRVAVRGELSQADFQADDEPLGHLLGEDGYQSPVLVDLSGVCSLDSVAVGWLLLCQKRFRTAGGALVLHSLSPLVQQLFDVLKMHLALTVAADEPSAAEIALRGRP